MEKSLIEQIPDKILKNGFIKNIQRGMLSADNTSLLISLFGFTDEKKMIAIIDAMGENNDVRYNVYISQLTKDILTLNTSSYARNMSGSYQVVEFY